MKSFLEVLRRPETIGAGESFLSWFDQIAAHLLHRAAIQIGEERYRFREIEFYYHSTEHPDPFAHRDPIQLNCGRWYFHRTGGVYRSGSFKGLDLAFGDARAFGGILIRGLAAEDGTLIDGPSLCVDHLIETTSASDVPTLDRAIGQKLAWDVNNPLRLEWIELNPHEVLRTARVGLSLKRAGQRSESLRFIGMPYRYLTEPRRIAKGKPQMVLALHASGKDPETIRSITGCTRQAIARYLADYEAGRAEGDCAPYKGIDLGPRELCGLLGAWDARRGEQAS